MVAKCDHSLNNVLGNAARQFFATPVERNDMHDDPWCHIRWKGMTDRRARQREAHLIGRYRYLNGQAPGDHVRIVDTTKQMSALRHVAALTGSAFDGEPARLPLGVGVLKRLPVDGGFLRELMAPGTKLRLFEYFRSDNATMGEGSWAAGGPYRRWLRTWQAAQLLPSFAEADEGSSVLSPLNCAVNCRFCSANGAWQFMQASICSPSSIVSTCPTKPGEKACAWCDKSHSS